MALADTLTAFAEIVADSIVNDAGQPVPTRVVRYYGHALPDDYGCEGDGVLSVWWPGPITAERPDQDCPGAPTLTLSARYTRCWQLPQVQQKSTTMFYDEWDAEAGVLSDVAEQVARRLMRLNCDQPPSGFDAALLALLRTPRFLDATPAGPLGGVAGVEWRINGALRVPQSS